MRLPSIICFLACTRLTSAFLPIRAVSSAASRIESLSPSVASYSTALTALSATSEARRQELLARTGPYFNLESWGGKIEFGATANLVTELGSSDEGDLIKEWLQDERALALSIWDEKLIQERGPSIYRLQTMNLQFVTIKLAPWVDMRMKTEIDPVTRKPVFTLQSIDFEPNVQIGPGMKISAESLGIVIEVVGELRPSADGRGVTGVISFQTTGKLPAPLRIVPKKVLQAAANAINNTIVQFAVRSFEKGARQKYLEFKREHASKARQHEELYRN
jgi:Protein of unknown function (DUF1997)